MDEVLGGLDQVSEGRMNYVGRLAPSPTGALHLGNVRTFMVAWLRARSLGGRVVFRMEDLDHPKDKPGAAAQAVEDLKWLGFDWDEEHVQSERKHLYRAALESLVARGLAYPCVCSRRDVESAQSAPHAGEQLHYPGTCRGRFPSWREAQAWIDERQPGSGRTPCWRFRVPEKAVVAFDDVFAGHFEQDVPAALGDFPLARDEFGAGYTLACAVDDLAMGVTEVVRGDDLHPATPAQILLTQALSPEPDSPTTRKPDNSIAYLHLPLVVGPDGKRLAKRHGDTRVAAFREAGWSAERLIGLLAASGGWAGKGEECSLSSLLPRFDLASIPRTPCVMTQQRFQMTK